MDVSSLVAFDPPTAPLRMTYRIVDKVNSVEATPSEVAVNTMFVNAVEQGVAGEVYAANHHAYEWLRAANLGWLPELEFSACALGGEDVIVLDGTTLANPIERFTWLMRNVNAFINYSALFSGMCVALARFMAKGGLLAEAVKLNGMALKIAPHHVLQNQQAALTQATAGALVPPFLTRYLGDDDKYMNQFICRQPFERFDLHPNGLVQVCCGQWTPNFVIGNAFEMDAPSILNSERAIAMRRSVTEGTYDYCHLTQCPEIGNVKLDDKATVSDTVLRRAIDCSNYEVEAPQCVTLCFDRTCNLTCPSCRTKLIVEPVDLRDKKMEFIEQGILPLLRKAKLVQLNAAGEAFVSKPTRLLLNRLNKEEFPDLGVYLITNGTLLNQRQWDAFPNIHSMVSAIRVSVDGASAETVEKLRRGADWSVLRENLEFVAKLRRELNINFFISFTYQLSNFREMIDFIQLGRSLGVTLVLFEKYAKTDAIEPEEYTKNAVHLPQHPLHDEFMEIIRHPFMRDPDVNLDLAYSAANRQVVAG